MSGAGGGPREVPIDSLSLQDLNQLMQQTDKELQFFGESLQELREVQRKFHDTVEAVEGLAKTEAGQSALIPLAESLYVSGKIANNKTVTVEIGTGYYAEMSVEKAKSYFERKEQYLSKQIEQILGVIKEKQRTHAVLNEVLQSKVQSQVQQTPQVSSA